MCNAAKVGKEPSLPNLPNAVPQHLQEQKIQSVVNCPFPTFAVRAAGAGSNSQQIHLVVFP
jgi:hypothetical protein